MEISINDLNFDLKKYAVMSNDEERINYLANTILNFSQTQNNNLSTLLDEEINDFYFKIISNFNRKIFSKKNCSSSDLRDFRKMKRDFKMLDRLKINDADKYIRFQNSGEIKKLQNDYDDLLLKCEEIVIVDDMVFYTPTESGGLHYDKKKIGYKVFLEYKRKINKPTIQKNRAFNLDYKFAILERMEFIKWCENNSLTKDSTAELLCELIGGAKSTFLDKLKPSYKMDKEIKQNAIDFVEKRILY